MKVEDEWEEQLGFASVLTLFFSPAESNSISVIILVHKTKFKLLYH